MTEGKAGVKGMGGGRGKRHRIAESGRRISKISPAEIFHVEISVASLRPFVRVLHSDSSVTLAKVTIKRAVFPYDPHPFPNQPTPKFRLPALIKMTVDTTPRATTHPSIVLTSQRQVAKYVPRGRKGRPGRQPPVSTGTARRQ
eukprot:687648-Hanusia_phi.AAC.1